MFNLKELAEFFDFPTLRDKPDFSLFLRFASGAFGEKLVYEGLFQLGGGLNDSPLPFDRPLNRRKDVRDLLLLGERGEWDSETVEACRIDSVDDLVWNQTLAFLRSASRGQTTQGSRGSRCLPDHSARW